MLLADDTSSYLVGFLEVSHNYLSESSRRGLCVAAQVIPSHERWFLSSNSPSSCLVTLKKPCF